MSVRDLVDFAVPPAEAGWYGVISLAGRGGARGMTTKEPLYFDGREWQTYPTSPWFRSKQRFDTAQQAQAWLDSLPS